MMKVEKHKKDERRYNEEVRAQEKKDNNSTSGKRGVKLNEHIEVGAEFQYEQMAKDKNEEARRKMETDCDLILSRKIFTVVSTESLQERQRAERELSIWIFREQRKPLYEDLDNDVLVGSGRSERACKAAPTLSLPMASKLLPRSNTEQQQDQHRKEMGLVSVQTENSVLVMAAQDIFTSFIDALASITSELKGISIVQSLRSDIVAEEVVAVSRPRPFLGLAHNHTERLADLFIQAGLGSRDDALLSVITPFHSRSLLPPLMKEYEQLKSQARNLRADGNWEQAENLLMALFDELEGKHPDGDTSSRSEELLKELGELYRKAMRSTDHSHRSFGYRGVRTMLKMRAEETNKTKEIRQNYGWVALELAKLHKDVDKVLTELQIEAKKDVGLVNAEITLQGTMQSESAYPIGLFMAEKFKKQIERETQSVRTQLLIWAAQKGCKELVEDLLCAGLDVNVHDEKRRTPLSYACERGYDDVSEYLLNKGATNTADEETHTPFTWAVKQGRCRVVQQFLTMNIDIELKDKEHERTPLSWAAEYGHDGVIKLLLNTGKVDVESRDKNYGQTPLSWAAEHGHDAVVKLLLNTGNVNVNSKDKDERTPLLQATANRHEAVVKLLLDTGKVDVNSEDKDGWTPLLQATKNGYDAVVKLLLDTGKVDVESKDKNYEQTPLSWAAEYGHDAIVKLLLDTGKVDVESKDRNGQTPLSWAALRGHRAVFELLLNTGNVNVNSEDKDGRTPLLQAAENGHEAVVELLLDNGNVNINSKDKDGRTPLSRAAEHGYEAVVKLLLATGKVDVDLEDNLRRTPLFWAAKHGFEEVVGLLLDTGEVNVDLKDFEGRTPLSWAAERGDEAIVKLLLGTSKIDVDLENNLRRTPLSLAAIYGHEAVVKLLLDTGKVDIESKDITGRTPLSWASKHGHEAVAKLLKGE
jgi:ankyrin repeat protein